MKIGIISDSHDNLPALRRAVAHFKRIEVDALLHAGDYIAPFAAQIIAEDQLAGIPLHGVYGNNDGERKGLRRILPQIEDGPMHLRLGQRHIVLHHFVDWIAAGQLQHAEVIVTGHTHEIVNETRTLPDGRQALFLNPGECGGWLTGRPTVALLDTEDLKAHIIDVTVSLAG